MKYDHLNLARKNDSEDFKKTQMVENLRKYVGEGEQKKQRIRELAARSGLSEETVFVTCCTFAGLDANVLKLHRILVNILAEYKQTPEGQAALAQQTPKDQSTEKSSTDNYLAMLQYLKDFAKSHSPKLYELAEVTGISPQKIVEIIHSGDSTPEEIKMLYGGIQSLPDENPLENKSSLRAATYEEPQSKAM